MNDFRYGGVTITGFSIIDYYSINTIKIISDLIEKDKPLNEIDLVPVSDYLLFIKILLKYLDFKLNY